MKRIFKFFRRHAVLRVVIAILILWAAGSAGLWAVEPKESGFGDAPQAAWNLMVYITSGFEGDQPATYAGKFIAVCVVVFGIALIGLFTATLASVFVENVLRKEKGMDAIRLRNHIVICGWNHKTEAVIRELHAPVLRTRRRPIVVIKRESETLAVDDAAPEFDDVYFIVGDPCNDRVLRRANVQEADTALIIADRSHLQYADAQSILIALAIEAMNSAVHTCVEVVNSDNLKHFAHTKVDECVSMEHLGELLISQAALNHGISSFYTELLTYQENGNEVYHVPMPGAFVGKTFGDLARRVLTENMIAAGLVQNGISRANPPRDTVLAADDKVIVISGVYPEIDGLAPERTGAAGGA